MLCSFTLCVVPTSTSFIINLNMIILSFKSVTNIFNIVRRRLPSLCPWSRAMSYEEEDTCMGAIGLDNSILNV